MQYTVYGIKKIVKLGCCASKSIQSNHSETPENTPTNNMNGHNGSSHRVGGFNNSHE